MLTTSRRFASHSRFAGRNRLAIAAAMALEQSSGLLVHPVAIVALCSLLTTDLTRLVFPAIVAPVFWITGYRLVPTVLARARRKLPWSIGAAIVRAASLALLAYVIAVDGVSGDQRLRSVVICVAAFAFASGLARGAAESLTPRVTSSRRRRRSDAVVAVIPAGLALVVGLSAFTLLLDVPRAPLTRLSTLFAVAAALSGAAVLALAWVVEVPGVAVGARRLPFGSSGERRPILPLAWMLISTATASAELLVLIGLVRSMELPRAYVLSGIGAVLVASAVASAVMGQILPALGLRALMQTSAVLSSIAFVLAIGLPTLVGAEQAPERLFGRRPAEVGIWGTMALIGVAQQARRRVLPSLADQTRTAPNLLNAAGLLLALMPLPIALVFERWDVQRWLLAGLALALLGIAVSGLISPRTTARRARRAVVDPIAPRRAVGSVGSGTVP